MLIRLPRPRLRFSILIFLVTSALLWVFLPYDNGLVLLIRWHFNTVSALTTKDGWLFESPLFPLDMADVAMIVKTGFSTRERLLAQLNAFKIARNQTNFVLVGDYSTTEGAHFKYNGLEIPVYNTIAWMIEGGALSSQPEATRLQYYSNLTAAIDSGNTELAQTIGETHGWELDIMKHVSGLEFAYRMMPHKKWYVMFDDDTYILEASFGTILGHLDPSVPHYIGNAVGDYKTRFAHGGSGVVLSQEAMRRIFIQNPDVVAAAHLESLEARWGDKLIATTAMKSGIYLEERYNRFFNGEPPRVTRIRPDRFCKPIVAFHKMSPSQLLDVGRTFKDVTGVVFWIDLWNIYKSPSMNNFLVDQLQPNWNYVGNLDEATMTTNDVKTKAACFEICLRHDSTCLAWTWESESLACHISPWMIIGDVSNGKFSGVNAARAIKLMNECPR